jgi:acetylornithine deacetylase/succinyl-diaminopimelate desuccinylase-like protein
VSADPEHKVDLERCAELGLATARAFGGRADIHRVPDGAPVVLGSFGSGKGRPTLTIYNHLDVVPAPKKTEPWRTDPFAFTRQGDTRRSTRTR